MTKFKKVISVYCLMVVLCFVSGCASEQIMPAKTVTKGGLAISVSQEQSFDTVNLIQKSQGGKFLTYIQLSNRGESNLSLNVIAVLDGKQISFDLDNQSKKYYHQVDLPPNETIKLPLKINEQALTHDLHWLQLIAITCPENDRFYSSLHMGNRIWIKDKDEEPDNFKLPENIVNNYALQGDDIKTVENPKDFGGFTFHPDGKNLEEIKKDRKKEQFFYTTVYDFEAEGDQISGRLYYLQPSDLHYKKYLIIMTIDNQPASFYKKKNGLLLSPQGRSIIEIPFDIDITGLQKGSHVMNFFAIAEPDLAITDRDSDAIQRGHVLPPDDVEFSGNILVKCP
ncbi:hypothetical protein GTO89_10115 [Heliobacterium gestii]|uniref:DUF4352 domain-containing protein n=1 Tax=Heliomicrobium gestii TaxID=2699 RepID=A0A845LG33_HELGE|nr:hypothetical protein [Heliomicrobium gestii]MBM7868197.1 hypothetical protein [Heliomicrobium gestii]MZP43395.1 hypothetical protein [Heliomicrobium gestii]